MIKRLLFIFIFCFASVLAQAQLYQWAKKVSDLSGTTVAVSDNFVVATGLILSSVTIGGHTYTSNGQYGYEQGFLAKYDLNGNVLWSHKIQNKYLMNPEVKIDAQDNIYLAGVYQDYLTIGQPIFANQPNTSRVFLAKFSSAGNLLWARRAVVTPVNANPFLKLATDLQGNVYLSGDFHNPITFGTTTLTSNGSEDIFLAKYNFKGDQIWVKNIGGTGYDNAAHLAISPTGNLFLTYRSDYTNRLIHKYNPAGNLVWQNSFDEHNAVISVDAAENVYLAGEYQDTVTFGTIKLPYTGTGISFKRNYFLSKLNSNGQWVWAKSLMTGNYDKRSFNTYYALAMDPVVKDHINLGCMFIDTAYINNQKFVDASIVAKIDTAGNPVNVTSFSNGNSGANFQEIERITTDRYGNNYITGEFRGPLTLGTTTLTHTGTAFGSSFLAKILQNANSVSGSMFIDWNGNGMRETNDTPYPGGLILVNPGNQPVNMDIRGNYSFYQNTGSCVLTPLRPNNHFTFLPSNHSVSFNGLNQHQLRDFALVPIPNRDDIKVTVTNITPARPGFALKYRLVFENVGTTAIYDSAFLNYNNQYLTYTGASENPKLQRPGKLAWTFNVLNPTEKKQIDAYFTVSATTPLNTQLLAHAVAYPQTDYLTWNNQDSLLHPVTGSFDPNDKQVDRTIITPTQVADSALLNYVIRFQNTGTDTAFTVIVRDSISDNLEMPTFELLSASHPYTFRFLDNGLAEWRFDNILLPDSNRNERASHGYIRYRMQAKTNLVLGNQISSRAAIYFDFNTPVITNYATTTVGLINGLNLHNSNIQSLRLYPNPAKNYVMIEADYKKKTTATVSLVNLLGRIISEITLPANNQFQYQLPLKELPKGIYIIQLETEAGRQTKRLIIQ